MNSSVCGMRYKKKRCIAAVDDESIAMRTCMSENTLATICHLSEFTTSRVPSVSDADLWAVYGMFYGPAAASVQ